jgi:pilus assembly protein Flp/PilA
MITRLRKRIRFLVRGDEGATAVEYAVMVALIAGVIIASVGTLVDETGKTYERVGEAVIPALGG